MKKLYKDLKIGFVPKRLSLMVIFFHGYFDALPLLSFPGKIVKSVSLGFCGV